MPDIRHVIECALEPKDKRDQERLARALAEIASKDSRFGAWTDQESGFALARAASEIDLNECVDTLIRDYGLKLNIGAPCVRYLETLKHPATIRYTHKRVLGPSSQFADVTITFEPLPAGSGFAFENATSAVPPEFVRAVEKGIRVQKESGLVAGFPVVDFRVLLVDAKYHEMDSNELTFDIAARAAFRELYKKRVAKLLEPVMKVDVTTPEDFLGSVMGDLKVRRGWIMGTEAQADGQIVTAFVPMSNLFGYGASLAAMTQGRARYAMVFDHYEDVRGGVPGDDGGDDTFPPAVGMRA